MNLKIALVANCPIAHQSMGGGDKTLIELAKFWRGSGAELTLFGPPEARGVCHRGGLDTSFVETSRFNVVRLGTAKTYLFRTVAAMFDRRQWGEFDVIYAASEALPDVVLAAKIKKQNRRAFWIVGFFLRARNPFGGEVPLRISSFLQLLQQRLSLILMRIFRVDGIFVAGKPDEQYILKLGFKSVLRIGGGVDLALVRSVAEAEKIYEACFVGRLSLQKGSDDLLKVWQLVVRQLPKAQLAVVGWGHRGEAEKFTEKIKELDLEKNVHFLGFLEGPEKFRVIKSAKLTLFPSRYESFGITLLESLAAGVPVVAYELEVLKENFSPGVIYVPSGQTAKMSSEVLSLLTDRPRLEQLARQSWTAAKSFDWPAIGEKSLAYLKPPRS